MISKSQFYVGFVIQRIILRHWIVCIRFYLFIFVFALDFRTSKPTRVPWESVLDRKFVIYYSEPFFKFGEIQISSFFYYFRILYLQYTNAIVYIYCTNMKQFLKWDLNIKSQPQINKTVPLKKNLHFPLLVI